MIIFGRRYIDNLYKTPAVAYTEFHFGRYKFNYI